MKMNGTKRNVNVIYIPYGRKFWREDILADCRKYVIWWNLLWRLGRGLAHYLCENSLMSWNAGTM